MPHRNTPKASPAPSPLQFEDHRLFLKAFYDFKKKNHQKFSYRKFAQELSFTYSNYLHLIIQGQRTLSPEGIERIKKCMPWSFLEKKFFHNLVLYNQSSDEEEQKRYLQELEKLRRQKRGIINPDQYAYFSKWYLPIIREIVSLKGFVSHLNWISKKLKPKLDEDVVLEALKILERLKMIISFDRGWKQSEEHLTTENEVVSNMIFNYHKEMLHLSEIALDFPAQDRDFSATTMSLSKSQLIWLKRRLIEFRDEIQQELQEVSEPPTLVAQLNMQLFQLTNDSN